MYCTNKRLKTLLILILFLWTVRVNAQWSSVIPKEQIEDAYVRNTGDTLNGDLVINGTISPSTLEIDNFLVPIGKAITFNDSNVQIYRLLNDLVLKDSSAGAKTLSQLSSSTSFPTGGDWSLTTDLNIDSNTLVIDIDVNRVGIGTTAPTSALDVDGTVTATAFSGSGASITGVDADTLDSIDSTNFVQTSRTVSSGSGLTGGGALSSNITLSHDDTSSQSSVDNSNGTVVQDLTLDTYGHLTGITSYDLDNRYYTETEVGDNFVNISGDTMTGALNMGNYAITNIDWSTSDDGAGSSLDADLLDGQHGSYYTNASNISSGNLAIARMPTGGTWELSSDLILNGAELTLREMYYNGSTYKSVNDYINIHGTVGKASGGIVTNNGNGTVAVSAGTGILKKTDDDVDGQLTFVDWEEDTSVELTNNSLNYVLVQYNGGIPSITATTDFTSINFNDEFVIGYVYRQDTDIDIANVGNHVDRPHIENCIRVFYDGIKRKNGVVIAQKTTRYVTSTAGLFYLGICAIPIDAFDSSVTNFENYYYRDSPSGWKTLTPTGQINNLNYDDGDGTLGVLTVNRYGVHWVYMCLEGDLNVVFGRGNYTLAEAQAAQPPATLPDYLVKFGILAGKIIIQQNASTYTSIQTAFTQSFSATLVNNHNDLANLQGGTASQYYHLTSTEYTGTGTGAFVRATSPTLTTPNIGVATATSISGIIATATGELAPRSESSAATIGDLTSEYYIEVTHNLDSKDVHVQTQFEPSSGFYSGERIEGSGTLGVIWYDNSVKVINNGNDSVTAFISVLKIEE